MKFLVLVAVVLAVAHAELTQEERACAAKTKFSITAAEQMSKDLHLHPEEPNVKQFLHCVYDTYGMFKADHKVDYEVLRTEMLKSYSAKSVNPIIDHCKNTKLTTDDFENAFLVTKCMCDFLHGGQNAHHH